MKTRAAVLYQPKTPLQVEEVTLDEPQGAEILVKLVATGVCHTDFHVIKGEMPRHPMPVVLGHEGAGIVEKTGPAVTTVKPGDHVVLMALPHCGKCAFCLSGQPTLCRVGLMSSGTGSLPGRAKRFRKGDQQLAHFFGQGSYAEYTVVHESTAVKVRNDAPLETVCILGCGVTTGIGGVFNTSGMKAGDSIVIYGCGGVGLGAVLGARVSGAGTIIAVDTLDQKLEKAKEMGADHVINATKENAVQKVFQITGQGADCSVECIGNVDVINQAFNSIRVGGRCVVLGLAPIGSKLTINPSAFTLSKTITGCAIGSINPPVDLPRYVDMFMGGRLPIDKLVTNSYSLDQINDAFDAMAKGTTIRSVIRFQD